MVPGQLVPSWHIYMKFIQMSIHNFCELHITNLTSELCAECRLQHNFLFNFWAVCQVFTNALTIPKPELSEIDQNPNSKWSFCLLGTFFKAGSYILKKFRERWKILVNSREKKLRKVILIFVARRPLSPKTIMSSGQWFFAVFFFNTAFCEKLVQ